MTIVTIEKTINLKTEFKKQKQLTDFIRSKHNIAVMDRDKHKGAIICELYEMANELKCEGFKVWTKKKRTGEVLGETVDVLHFYLEMGNDLHVVEEHHWIEKHPTIMKQILAINNTLLSMDGPLTWALSFAQFRGLVEMLGFDWEKEIIPEYNKKHQINIDRQVNGY